MLFSPKKPEKHRVWVGEKIVCTCVSSQVTWFSLICKLILEWLCLPPHYSLSLSGIFRLSVIPIAKSTSPLLISLLSNDLFYFLYSIFFILWNYILLPMFTFSFLTLGNKFAKQGLGLYSQLLDPGLLAIAGHIVYLLNKYLLNG